MTPSDEKTGGGTFFDRVMGDNLFMAEWYSHDFSEVKQFLKMWC
jgi:hypothetical protein